MLQERNGIYFVVLNYKEGSKWKKKWISTGTGRYRDAKAIEKKIMSDAAAGILPVRSKASTPTLREFLFRWLDVCIKPPSRKPATYESYLRIAKTVSDFMGDTKIDRLDSSDIDAYMKARLKAGTSHTTVRIEFRTLRSALNTARRWKLLVINPCTDATQPAAEKNRARVADVADVQKLLAAAAAENNPMMYVVVTLGALCGLRRGEICGLEWKDVDFDRSLLHIRHSLSRRENSTIEDGTYYRIFPGTKSSLVLDHTKTLDSESDIFIPPIAVDALRRMYAWRNKNRLALGPCFKDSGLVTSHEDGRPAEPNWIYTSFIKFLDKLGLPRMRVHDLRHTAATILLMQGVDIKLVSRQLRHSDITITQNTYQHVTEALAKKSAAAMDELFPANGTLEKRRI